MRLSRLLTGAVMAGALLLSACSDSKDDSAAPTVIQPTTAPSGAATIAATSVATPAGQAPASATATPASQSTTKVSANNGTRAQLEAAFIAAGITGAAQWAKEVEEYRPYPAGDPTMAKLRQNLVKYNPGPGVVDKIVAALSLP